MSPCPHLPALKKPITAADSKALGKDRGEAFYRFRLAYAQSKLADGLPAQAILQINRALAAELRGEEPVLAEWPLPYAALVWVLEARTDREGQFLGNPRRHWQHYASRMSGPRARLRTWRSWACFWLCEGRLSESEFPRDEEQIEAEGLAIPTLEEVARQLGKLGLPGERALWESLLRVL